MTRSASIAFFALLLLPPSAWADDALDKVTGTAGWREGASSDPRTEWRDWLRARSAWRAARRMLRIEATRNRQLEVLRRRGRPRGGAVRKVMQAGPKDWRRGAPRAQPRHRIRIRRGASADEDDEDEDEGSKVPVERLDNGGQAVDKEGDRLFDRPARRRR